ncbi:hypothetical protein [Nesterenkonia rhizosphaerae]|uniref:Uncharacterized protein n=1 Tax=Nesterenkonia rhizosphaerae TaxID=1348272 RepID=A0ABP9FZS1_9MICC
MFLTSALALVASGSYLLGDNRLDRDQAYRDLLTHYNLASLSPAAHDQRFVITPTQGDTPVAATDEFGNTHEARLSFTEVNRFAPPGEIAYTATLQVIGPDHGWSDWD